MARISEHIFQRTIYNHKNLSSGSITTLRDASNYYALSLINDLNITNDTIYKDYTDKKNLCTKYRDNFLNRHKNIKQNLSNNSIAKEYFYESFHKKLPSKDAETPLLLSVIDMEKFLAEYLHFSLTIEDEIKKYFDTSLINDPNGIIKISTFKDNTNNSCSDKILLFNLSMILVVNEITDTPFPFSILNKSLNCSLPEKLGLVSESNTQRLFSIHNALSKIKFTDTRILFSEECIRYFFASNINCNPSMYITILNAMQEYLRQERKFICDLYRNKRFDFLIIFLPYLGIEVKSSCDIMLKKITDFYADEIHKYRRLITDIKQSSNELWNKYCSELPNLISYEKEKENQKYIHSIQFEIQETADKILSYFKNSLLNNQTSQISRFLTILANLSCANDVKQFIELLYNICAPESDNITTISHEIFFHNYALRFYEYCSETKDDLNDILNKCSCSLYDAEILAWFLSNLICDDADWHFICSVLSAQNDEPIWYKSFFEIIKLIRGSDFVVFDKIIS